MKESMKKILGTGLSGGYGSSNYGKGDYQPHGCSRFTF